MKLSHESQIIRLSRTAALGDYERGQKNRDIAYAQNKIDMFMDLVTNMHLTASVSHQDAVMIVKIIKDLEQKYGTDVRIKMENERRYAAFMKIDQIYRTRLGPAIQDIYDICFDEIAPAEK